MPIFPSTGAFFSQSPGSSSDSQSEVPKNQPERQTLPKKTGRANIQREKIQGRTKKGRTILNPKRKQKHKKIRRGIKSKINT